MKRLLTVVLLAGVAFAQGGTTSANILPATTGQDLGKSTQRWDIFAKDINASGTVTVSAPVNDTDAATKKYVDDTDTGNVKTTGDQSITGTKTFADVKSDSVVVGAMLQIGAVSGDFGTAISSCIAELPASGGTCDFRGVSGNVASAQTTPLYIGTSSKSVTLLLGPIQWTTAGAIVTGVRSHVIGLGRDVTTIKPTAGFDFTANKGIVSIGDATTGVVMGSTVERLTINAASVANSTCGYSAYGEEQSGFRDVSFTYFTAHGLWKETSNAQNSADSHLYLYSPDGTASTVPILLDNIDAYRGLTDVTVDMTGSTGVAADISLQGTTGGNYMGIHGENATNVIENNSSNAVSIFGADGGPNTTTVIHVPAANTGTMTVIGILRNYATNTIKDEATNQTKTEVKTAFYSNSPFVFVNALKLYGYGNGINTPSVASYSGNFAITSAGLGTFKGGLTLNNAGISNAGAISGATSVSATSYSVGATAGVDKTCTGSPTAMTVTKGIITAITCP